MHNRLVPYLRRGLAVLALLATAVAPATVSATGLQPGMMNCGRLTGQVTGLNTANVLKMAIGTNAFSGQGAPIVVDGAYRFTVSTVTPYNWGDQTTGTQLQIQFDQMSNAGLATGQAQFNVRGNNPWNNQTTIAYVSGGDSLAVGVKYTGTGTAPAASDVVTVIVDEQCGADNTQLGQTKLCHYVLGSGVNSFSLQDTACLNNTPLNTFGHNLVIEAQLACTSTTEGSTYMTTNFGYLNAGVETEDTGSNYGYQLTQVWQAETWQSFTNTTTGVSSPQVAYVPCRFSGASANASTSLRLELPHFDSTTDKVMATHAALNQNASETFVTDGAVSWNPATEHALDNVYFALPGTDTFVSGSTIDVYVN